MPGFKVFSGVQRELRRREEISGEPKLEKKTRKEKPPPRPHKGTGRPWQISHCRTGIVFIAARR
jgi:hypothetical protein